MNKKELEMRVELKKVEIEHYKGCLDRYGPGRWRNQGLRHLADLEEELVKLEKEFGDMADR